MSEPFVRVGSLRCSWRRKPIRNFHVYVRPPDGRVDASLPLDLPLDVLRLFLLANKDKIEAKRREIRERLRQTPRRFVSGESHYLWGVRYTLSVKDAPQWRFRTSGRRLFLERPASATPEQCAARFDTLCRVQLRDRVEERLPVLCRRMGVDPAPRWLCQKMSTRWGSCSPERRLVRINSVLARKPPECLDFVLVHELCHLFERHHTPRFYALLDRFMPDWSPIRKRLNDFILDPDL